MSGRRLVALVLAAAAAAGAYAEAAGAGVASRERISSVVPRPTAGGALGYGDVHVESFAAQRAVVHYVTSGPDAPPLKDGNGDGRPDYVEEVAAAADHALAYFLGRGLRAPRADGGGPDTRPDLYLKALAGGVRGTAVRNPTADGGAFVVVSSSLDPSRVAPSASLALAVAEQLFHLVVDAYATRSAIPRWAAEGTAIAMSLRAFPEIDDEAAYVRLTSWLRAPGVSLANEGSACARCPGSAIWWLFLDEGDHALVRLFLQRAGAAASTPTDGGRSLLDRLLRERHRTTLAAVFHTFALNVYRAGLSPAATSVNARRTASPATGAVTLGALGARYVRVSVSRDASGVAVAVPAAGANAVLVVGGPDGRVVTGRRFRTGGGMIVSTMFRDARERDNVLLVVTNGGAKPAAHRLAPAALGPSGKLPGWIAWR